MRVFSLRTTSKLALVAALLGSAGGCTLSGRLRGPGVVVTDAPPPPRREAVVAARENYIWVDGHQRWDSGRYVWQAGRYERMRPGQEYAPGRWHRERGGHVWIPGEWRSSSQGRAPHRRL